MQKIKAVKYIIAAQGTVIAVYGSALRDMAEQRKKDHGNDVVLLKVSVSRPVHVGMRTSDILTKHNYEAIA